MSGRMRRCYDLVYISQVVRGSHLLVQDTRIPVCTSMDKSWVFIDNDMLRVNIHDYLDFHQRSSER